MPPFRMLDRVLSADLARGQLVALRTLTSGDAFDCSPFLSTFPDVLIIEALCQAAACLNALELASRASATGATACSSSGAHLGYLVAISNFRFPAISDRPRIGDTLELHVERQGQMGALSAFSAKALVYGETEPGKIGREGASGRLLFAVQPK